MFNQVAPHQTRNRIVATAMRLFWEKGYQSTSVADLLSAAGVNSGSLYHFFAGKQEVLLAVLDAYHKGIRPMLLEPAWAGTSDPIERVFALLLHYRSALVSTDYTYGCPIGSLALELHEPDPPVRALLAANFHAWRDAVRKCLVATRPRLPPKVDPTALAELVLATMEGAVMLARTHRSVAPLDACIKLLRDYFARLGAAPASPPRGRSKPKPRRRNGN